MFVHLQQVTLSTNTEGVNFPIMNGLRVVALAVSYGIVLMDSDRVNGVFVRYYDKDVACRAIIVNNRATLSK